LQAEVWILRKENEPVASGPSFSEIPCPHLESFAPLFRLDENVIYHSRARLKEAQKQVICFSNESKNYGKMCQRRQLSSVQQAAKLYNKFLFLSYVCHALEFSS